MPKDSCHFVSSRKRPHPAFYELLGLFDVGDIRSIKKFQQSNTGQRAQNSDQGQKIEDRARLVQDPSETLAARRSLTPSWEQFMVPHGQGWGDGASWYSLLRDTQRKQASSLHNHQVVQLAWSFLLFLRQTPVLKFHNIILTIGADSQTLGSRQRSDITG